MSTPKRVVTVFIASPGGLDTERDGVERAATDVGAMVLRQLGTAVTVLRWEQMVGDAGNPQAQINPSVDDADIFVGIVGRRWGTPTGNGPTSGFEEEFYRALERRERTGAPRIALFFKNIAQENIDDAGTQLAAVLAFRRRIEADHAAMYTPFSSAEELQLRVSNVVWEICAKPIPIAPTVAESDSGGVVAIPERLPDHDPISAQVADVLDTYSSALRGYRPDARLDADRLVMFALAASRDNEFFPVHVVNRIFQRRHDIRLSSIETKAWFRTVLNDIGRADSSSARVIPFFSMLPDRSRLETLCERVAATEADDEQVFRGLLRVVTALRLRPAALWPERSNLSSPSWQQLWEMDSAATKEAALTYWLRCSRGGDRNRAKVLSTSDKASARSFGATVAGLLAPRPTADHLAAYAPAMLLSPEVVALFPDGRPLGSVETSALESFITSTYRAGDSVALAAVEALALRDEVSESVIITVLKEKTFSSRLSGTGTWIERARAVLFDRAVSAAFLDSFAAAVASGKCDQQQTRLAAARLARRNPSFSATAEALGPETLFDADAADVRITRLPVDDALAEARLLLTEEHPRANAFLDLARAGGMADRVLAYVREGYFGVALRASERVGRFSEGSEWVRKARDIAHGSTSERYDAIVLLVDVLRDKDIDLMLEMSYLFRDRADFHTKLAEAATLRRLRGWVTGNEERLAIEALDELRRRNRPEPRKRLMRLLRSSHNDVRIAALAQLVDGATREDLSALLREYLSAENYHYYNVLCELDRLMAEVPPLYRQ